MRKHEEGPGLAKITALRQSAEREGRRHVSILVGNGGLHYPQELARGVDGAMTGFAFPEMLVEVYKLHAAGSRDAAEDLFDAYLPLVGHEQQPGIGQIGRASWRERVVQHVKFAVVAVSLKKKKKEKIN